MIQMRAVPGGFDNIQALHHPYGAAQRDIVAPQQNLGDQQFAPHPRRPLVSDATKTEVGERPSSGGMAPAFDGSGFDPTSVSNISMSTENSASSNRYNPFGEHESSLSDRINYASLYSMNQNRLSGMLHSDQQGVVARQDLGHGEPYSRRHSDTTHSPPWRTLPVKGKEPEYPGFQPDNSSLRYSAASPHQQALHRSASTPAVDIAPHHSDSYYGETISE